MPRACSRPIAIGDFSPTELQIASAVLDDYWQELRDLFIEQGMTKLKKTKFVVNAERHDTARHFAACHTNGLLVEFAPQMADMDADVVRAIMAHELGHAADHAYPAHWMPGPRRSDPAVWVGDAVGTAEWNKWHRLWQKRDDDQVEFAADAIAFAVTGHRINYVGRCLIQTFGKGVPRPLGLR